VHDTSSGHSSSLWDKLTAGGYVANLYTTAYRPKLAGYTPGLKACTSPAKASSAKTAPSSKGTTPAKTASATKTTKAPQTTSASKAATPVKVANLLQVPTTT